MDLFKEYGTTKEELLKDIQRAINALLKADKAIEAARLDTDFEIIKDLLKNYKK